MTTLVFVPAIVLALIGRLRGKGVRLGLAVGLLSLIGLLDVSGALASGTVGCAAALRWARHRACQADGKAKPQFLGTVRRTLPVLAGAWLAIMLVTIGGRAWASTARPPPCLPHQLTPETCS